MRQPWAELVVSGRKSIEIRKWNTKFRGKFLVHASKNVDKEAMQKFGFSDLPLGCLVGKAELVDVIKYDKKSFMADRRRHLATSDWGSYGFILRNTKRILNKECKGRLGFWEWRS